MVGIYSMNEEEEKEWQKPLNGAKKWDDNKQNPGDYNVQDFTPATIALRRILSHHFFLLLLLLLISCMHNIANGPLSSVK